MRSRTPTLLKQISIFTGEESMFSPADSHANPTVSPEKEKERRITAISGRKCCESLEKFDRVGWWAKTFTALLIGQEGWYSNKCRLTWKLRGTKCSRMYCQLAVLTHLTKEIGYGLSHTPTAKGNQLAPSMYRRETGSWGLLPTPTKMDDAVWGDMKHVRRERLRKSPSLATLAVMTNPDGNSSQLNPRFIEEIMGYPIGYTELNPSATQ